MVGKYVDLTDAYKSLNEALHHGGIANEAKVEIVYVDSEKLEDAERARPRGRHPGAPRLRLARRRGQDPRGALRPRAPRAVLRHLLRHADGGDRVRAPRGGARGRELGGGGPRDAAPGDRAAARAARRRGQGRHHAPRRLALRRARGHARLRGLRHAARSPSATATATSSTPSTATALSRAGLVLSGTSPDGRLVEIVELEDHPWFLGCQFHPEFQSTPFRPHPLFVAFIAAAAEEAGRAGVAPPCWLIIRVSGALAQLVRAPCSHRGGQWFESTTPHHPARLRGPVAQLDRAPASEAGGRRFESCLGHHSLAHVEVPGSVRVSASERRPDGARE